MSIYHLQRQQFIRAPINEVWDFFSHPKNLSELTPRYMNLRITSSHVPEHIYPGQIITYKVSPLLGVPLSWMTEITHVRNLELFVDEQRHGPYAIWHHEHHFKQQDGGVMMTDIVHYKLPLAFLGRMAHLLFVKRQLDNIFDHRYKKIETLYANHSQHF